MKTFEELKLWNDMIFVDIPKDRRLVCSQCGSRNLRVMPIFPAAKGTPKCNAAQSGNQHIYPRGMPFPVQ